MFTYAMQSKMGSRDYNEDYIQMQQKENRVVFVLGDGLGGCGNGEIASASAVSSVIARFCWQEESEDFLKEAIEGAQKAVVLRQSQIPGTERMSTTLVILQIKNDIAQWVHIGDSRLYLFRNGKVIMQTLDHSIPQMLVKMGEIRPEQIRKHPDRNRLLSAIGPAWDEKRYEISEEVQLESGDGFLLCSDGFWEYITEKKMGAEFKNADSAAEWLKKMTAIVEHNGSGENMDNYSAICVKFE